LVAALQTFTGDYLQAPPPYSAKKIANRRAYDLARAGTPVQPGAAPVSVRRLELTAFDGTVATLEITCSAGFYVRSLAHDLGKRLGVGGCLSSLRRTRSGEFNLSLAVSMEVLARSPDTARSRLVAMDRLLPGLPSVTVTPEGEKRISHGRAIEPAHIAGPPSSGSALALPGAAPSEWVRLLGPGGGLLALARPGQPAGSLHPSVVLI
jgi:tRNA pseudouridine55 synthase